VNAQRVLEDVVVTDSHGNAVHGLTRDAFTLKEDGEAQRILSFDVHDGSKEEFVPPKGPPLPPNTYVDLPSAPEQGPLYVILYDMVNMSMDDQVYPRKGLLKFIDSKPPGTRFAIFLHSDRTSLIQGFTQDRNLLRAALISEGSGPHLPDQFLYAENYGQGDEGTALSLFAQLARFLKGVPGRKNLIWLADNFPLDLFPDPDSLLSQDDVKEVIAALTRSQVALYPVDVRGAKGGYRTLAAYIDEDAIAEATGGMAEYNNNDISVMLDKATDAGSSYYTLSYSPANRKEDDEERKIEVKVEGARYHLAYRRVLLLRGPEWRDGAEAGIARGLPACGERE
jgi:VWFA-related protein